MAPPALPVWLMLWLAFLVWDIQTPDLVAVRFFPLIAVVAAMGKAEDGASIVALVPFIAEKGKGVWGSGADK